MKFLAKPVAPGITLFDRHIIRCKSVKIVSEKKLGISGKGISFLTDPGTHYQLAVWTSVWKSTGWWSIIFLVAIAGIAPGLYEAAMMDGAGRLKRIWHITLPGILPAIITVLILSVGSFPTELIESVYLENLTV